MPRHIQNGQPVLKNTWRCCGASQYAGRNATQIERRHNTEYTNIKLPIVEFFRWVFTDGTIRLEEFNVQSNAEVRCSFRMAPWLQLFGENICDTTQPAPLTVRT